MALCSCKSGNLGPRVLDLDHNTLELLFSPLRQSGVLWTRLATLGMFARERGIQNNQRILGFVHRLKKGTAVLTSNNLAKEGVVGEVTGCGAPSFRLPDGDQS